MDEAYHSRSAIDALSPPVLDCAPSLSSATPACRAGAFSASVTFATSVTCFRRSLASALRSAGFLAGLMGATTPRPRLRMQKTHRLGELTSYRNAAAWLGDTYNGAKTTTTNTGMRNAKAVGVMPLCPTVCRQSLLSKYAGAS
jgi:hypothetical protein